MTFQWKLRERELNLKVPTLNRTCKSKSEQKMNTLTQYIISMLHKFSQELEA